MVHCAAICPWACADEYCARAQSTRCRWFTQLEVFDNNESTHIHIQLYNYTLYTPLYSMHQFYTQNIWLLTQYTLPC